MQAAKSSEGQLVGVSDRCWNLEGLCGLFTTGSVGRLKISGPPSVGQREHGDLVRDNDMVLGMKGRMLMEVYSLMLHEVRRRVAPIQTALGPLLRASEC